MKIRNTLTFLLLLTTSMVSAQSRNLTGTVIDEELERMPYIIIYDQDTVPIGKTDSMGNFEIILPQSSPKLVFGYVGMEWEIISVPDDCEHLEVIMLLCCKYGYRSHRKIDRLRKRQFDNRMELHVEAFKRGLFNAERPCFSYTFIPDKPALDEIRTWMKEIDAEVKENFQELSIGDTVLIPFSARESNGASLAYFSHIIDRVEFDCMIQGVIIGKSKRKRGYNLTYMVTHTNWCQYDSIVLNGREMEVGEIFEYNMKYCKILIPKSLKASP